MIIKWAHVWFSESALNCVKKLLENITILRRIFRDISGYTARLYLDCGDIETAFCGIINLVHTGGLARVFAVSTTP